MSSGRVTAGIIVIALLSLCLPFGRGCWQSIRFASVFYTPVTFYGKVVDQHGAPIPDADVEVSVLDRPSGKGPKLKLRSDKNGEFVIHERGMSISMNITSPGYYRYPSYDPLSGKTGRYSGGGFLYAKLNGSAVHQPVKSAPFIFTLYRPFLPTETVRIPRKEVSLPRDGTSVVFALKEKDRDLGKSIVLRCWTHEEIKTPEGHYDWRMEIAVSNGSLQPRLDDYDFIAPASGYAKVQTIDMPASLEGREWKDMVSKTYWLSFDDGTFGSLKVEMIAHGDHFAIVKGLLNPKTGSRNMEADPKQR